MDTSVLAIGIIAVFAFLFPIWLISRIATVKENRLKKFFKESCDAHQLSIKEPEVIKRKIIGIDEASRTLLFVNKQVVGKEPLVVDLKKMTSCRVFRKAEKTSLHGNEQEESVYRIDIILYSFHTPPEEIVVNFFDVNTDNPFDAYPMHEKAMEWQKRISKLIKSPEKVMEHR